MEPWPTTRSPCARSSLLVLLAVLWVGLAPVPAAADRAPAPDVLTFRLAGDVQATRSVAEVTATEGGKALRVFEPYEEDFATFTAVPLNAVLDSVYGKTWRSRDEVLLTCRDGYQPSFPVSRLLAYDAWLAVGREDAERFSILKLERGKRVRVDLSPIYLVWDNAADAELRAQGDYGWPYQLVGIDLIDARKRFPLMTPPSGSSTQVESGFEAFRMHCTRCHKINGEGGGIGPELNSPTNPTDYRDVAWLRQWIDDPASLVAVARMPRLNVKLKERSTIIDDVIAYLSAMAKHKVDPSSRAGDGS